MIQMPPGGRRCEADGRSVTLSAPTSTILRALDHRTRNNYAALLALVDVTRASTDDVSAFAKAMTGYIRAVASAHELLSRSEFRSLELRDLIEALAGPSHAALLNIDGPSVQIASRQAIAFAFVIQQIFSIREKKPDQCLVDMHWGWIDETRRRLRFTCCGSDSVPASATSLIEGLVRSELRGHAQISRGQFELTLALDPVEP